MKLAVPSFLLFALVFLSPAQAADWKTSVGGEVGVEAMDWTNGSSGPDDKNFRDIFTGRLPSTVRYGEFRLRANPLVQYDPQNPSSSERFYWDFPEGYLQWQSMPWTVQVGLNTFSWGDTDVFNPLDVLNPRRYYDPLRSEKIGTAAVVVKREFEDFFVEGVYIPVQRRTLLPGDNSRWLPRDIYRIRDYDTGTTSGPARLILPQDLSYSYDPYTEQDNALKNNFAFRAKFRLPGFDWTLAFFDGASVVPDVYPSQINAHVTGLGSETSLTLDDPFIPLGTEYYRVRMTGTSFTWVLGDFLVKGASAYTHLYEQLDPTLPPYIWENALGLERTFSLGTGSLTALLQSTYVKRNDPVDSNAVSIARMFDKAAMTALRWAPTETITVLASYLRDFKYDENLFHGEGSYKFRDGWLLRISGDALGGAMGTPLGSYAHNNRITTGVVADF